MDHLPTPVCPLVTPFTRKLGIPDETMERILRIRQWDIENGSPIPFQWPSALRKTIWNLDTDTDSGVPLEIRKYQLQQIHNMVRLRWYLNGDAVGLGKTLAGIASICWLRERNPQLKAIIFCTKSTFRQWVNEFRRFSTLRAVNLEDKHGKLKGYPARYKQMEELFAPGGADVLVCRYTSMTGKRRKVEGKFDEDGRVARNGAESISQEIRRFAEIVRPHGSQTVLLTDEAQKYKAASGVINILVQMIQKQCAYRWAMTATAIKNDLREFYCIAASNGIKPFGTIAEFADEFCIFRDIEVKPGISERQLVGYRNIARFKEGMRPFFLGRSQKQVKEPLPLLTTLIHPIDLDEEQKRLLLHDIPSGAYKLPPKLLKVHGQEVYKDRDPDNMMTQLACYRLVANSAALLDPTDKKTYLSPKLSPKEECLLDLLDGDLKGEKVLVFTVFRTHIDRLQALTEAGQFTDRKFLRITGAESVAQRSEAQAKFQKPDSGYDVLFINEAAIEGINLQQAAHLVALDLPFSWGNLLQLVGRMVRMASPHSACTLHLLPARGSIDEFTIETLKGKKGVFDKILGESHSAGILNDSELLDLDSGMEQVGSDAEFRSMVKAHAKSTGMKVYLSGELLTEATQDKEYKMAFEKGAKKKTSRTQKYDDYIPEDVEALWG